MLFKLPCGLAFENCNYICSYFETCMHFNVCMHFGEGTMWEGLHNSQINPTKRKLGSPDQGWVYIRAIVMETNMSYLSIFIQTQFSVIFQIYSRHETSWGKSRVLMQVFIAGYVWNAEEFYEKMWNFSN